MPAISILRASETGARYYALHFATPFMMRRHDSYARLAFAYTDAFSDFAIHAITDLGDCRR